MRDSRIQGLYNYWRSKQPPGGLPDRADLSPVDMKTYLPQVFLYQRDDHGEVRVRLMGTALSERYGRNVTGQIVLDQVPPGHRPFYRKIYDTVLDGPAGALLYFEHLRADDSRLEIQFIYLPLTHGGDRASIIIGVCVPVENNLEKDDLGGSFERPKLTAAGWIDLGFGRPATTILDDFCRTLGAEVIHVDREADPINRPGVRNP